MAFAEIREAAARQRVMRVPVSQTKTCGHESDCRYLVQDHDKHARAAGKLFDACDRGDGSSWYCRSF